MCKLSSVSVSTLLVELVSLVSLAFVSLVPLSWLGDRVDIGLGVAAGVGVRLLHLSLFTRSSMLILLSCSAVILVVSRFFALLACG